MAKVNASIAAALLVSALVAVPPAARATGSEMSGLALAVPMLLAGAGIALILLLWLLLRILPRNWPRPRRWTVSLVGSPLLLALSLLLASGAGLLQQLLARLLPP